jgi:HSP20 family protein
MMFLTTRPQVGRMNGVSALEQTFNRLFNEALTGMDWQARDSAAASWVPPVDVFEAADEIRILAEVPGVKPEDVKISVEGNVLTVQGTKHQVVEETTDRVHRYERTYGSFERTFTLPATVDSTKIKAGYENGVLTLSLPKAEKAKPRQIQVEVVKS